MGLKLCRMSIQMQHNPINRFNYYFRYEAAVTGNMVTLNFVVP